MENDLPQETYTNEEFNKFIGVLLDHDGRERVAYFHNNSKPVWVARHSVSTGRLITRKIGIGRSIYSAEVPEMVTQEPMVSPTLKDLAIGVASEKLARLEEHPYRNYSNEDTAVKEEDTAFLSALQTRFETELAEYLTNKSPGSETVTCHNCDGTGKVMNTCWDCSQGVQDVHMGMVANDDDLIIDTPHPKHEVRYEVLDCELCHGTKTYEVACYPCNSTGQVPQVVNLTFIGENGVETVTTDILKLIRNNDVKFVIQQLSSNRHAALSIQLDVSPLKERLIRSLVGEDKKILFTTTGKRIMYPDEYLNPIHMGTTTFVRMGENQYGETQWKPTGVEDYVEPFDVPLEFEDAYRKLIGWDISNFWEEIQHSFTSRYVYAWQPESNKESRKEYLEHLSFSLTDDEVINGVTVSVLEEKDNMTLVKELAELAGRKDYGLELSYGFIATEQAGPEIILTTRGGLGYTSIGLDYSWTLALTSALLLLEEKIDEIPPAEILEDWYLRRQEENNE